MKKYIIAFLLTLAPLSVQAFSEGFKKDMSAVQSRVLLKNGKFTLADARQCWDKFEKEVLGFLNEAPIEGELARKTAREALSFREKRKGEVEDIELGNIEAKVFKLDSKGKVWLVAFYNDMGFPMASTFHIYREADGKFSQIASFEDTQGPWDSEVTQFGDLQVQKLPTTKDGKIKFTTLHQPRLKNDKSNRSQIVWELGDSLVADYYIPEVDWHTVDGRQLPGRGEAVAIRPAVTPEN